jgi:hypothetical protein
LDGYLSVIIVPLPLVSSGAGVGAAPGAEPRSAAIASDVLTASPRVTNVSPMLLLLKMVFLEFVVDLMIPL